MRFEWDEAKNAANRRKHGLSFEDASTVFLDPLRLLMADRSVDGEERWHTLGRVKKTSGYGLILVVHTLREELGPEFPVEVVRMISARRAVPREKRKYADENG